MADPFEILRLPDTAVDPHPTFAARLRARVERALALPEGVTVSDLTIDAPTPAPVPAPPRGRVPARRHHPLPTSLLVTAGRALDWYVSALGAERRGEVITDG